jgi:type IV pilus assembly protein PilA
MVPRMQQPPYPPGATYSQQPYPPQPGMQPGQPPGQPPAKKGMSTCLIVVLVVAALSVPVVIILGAMAVYGVRKYISNTKTLEARASTMAIAHAASAAYEREPVAGGGTTAHRLCGSAKPVPASVPKAERYQPSSAPGADFQGGDASNGWTCLKFALSAPTYYQHRYETGVGSGKSGATANGFEASARGDLDGNGVTSLFAVGADVKNGVVVVSPTLYVENEFE